MPNPELNVLTPNGHDIHIPWQVIKMVTRLPYKGNNSQFNTIHIALHLQGVETLSLYIYKV